MALLFSKLANGSTFFALSINLATNPALNPVFVGIILVEFIIFGKFLPPKRWSFVRAGWDAEKSCRDDLRIR